MRNAMVAAFLIAAVWSDMIGQTHRIGVPIAATLTGYRSEDHITQPCDELDEALPIGFETGLAYQFVFDTSNFIRFGAMAEAGFRRESGSYYLNSVQLPGLDDSGNVVVQTLEQREDVNVDRWYLQPSLTVETEFGLGLQVGLLFEFHPSGSILQSIWSDSTMPIGIPVVEDETQWLCDRRGIVSPEYNWQKSWSLRPGFNVGLYWVLKVYTFDVTPYINYRVTDLPSWGYVSDPIYRFAGGFRILLRI